MCDFCRNKKKIIDGKGNLVLFGAENNMIFDNSDGRGDAILVCAGLLGMIRGL